MSPGVERLLREALEMRQHSLGTARIWLEDAEAQLASARTRVAELEQEIGDLERALGGDEQAAADAPIELDLGPDANR